MRRILITGATGFIGSYLFKYLKDLRYNVQGINSNEFKYPEQFIRTKEIVIHCAWIREQDLHSLEHIKFGAVTCQFFEECKRRGIRVINLGSSSEYGVKFEPMKEDMICEPINTYGLAKLMVTLHAKKLGFNTLRLFTVVGEGGHSFFDIKDKTDKWEYPFSHRDTIDIKHVCKAIERLIHAEHLYGEVINVGTGIRRFYVNENDLKINKNKWFKHPQRQYEPSSWVASTEKMKKLLNI